MEMEDAPSSLVIDRGDNGTNHSNSNSNSNSDSDSDSNEESTPMEVDDGNDGNDGNTDVGPLGPNGEWEMDSLDSSTSMESEDEEYNLDCYPYTFTPLLLFAPSSYFDKGYSNYNSVAQFFSSVMAPLNINMLENVLFDRKNMLYEELLDYVIAHEMLVVCCIDSHFTAFQVIHKTSSSSSCSSSTKKGKPLLLYYDPLRPNLKLVPSDSYKQFALFQLMKCNYGDSQHIQEHKDHYTGLEANSTRRMIYQLWKKINSLETVGDLSVPTKSVPLNTTRYLLVNDKHNPRNMSTQLTSNTCYFQTYLYVFPFIPFRSIPILLHIYILPLLMMYWSTGTYLPANQRSYSCCVSFFLLGLRPSVRSASRPLTHRARHCRSICNTWTFSRPPPRRCAGLSWNSLSNHHRIILVLVLMLQMTNDWCCCVR
jgi:hypothetical protein